MKVNWNLLDPPDMLSKALSVRVQKNFAENNYSPLREVHRIAEKDAIELALKRAEYNKAQAAKILGINRSLLYKKMAKHQISLHPD